RGALLALVRICKETPAKGEPFRELRTRLRAAKLWERDRPAVLLRFLGTGGATAMPSLFMQSLAAANGDDETAIAVLDRLWHLNPLLGKTVLELVAQRAYHKDEIYKHLASAAYRGIVPSRPGLETWLQIAIGTGLLRTVGIAVTAGPRAERYIALAGGLDVDEFLAEDRPEPEPVVPQLAEDDAVPEPAAPDASTPAAAPAGSLLPAPLRHLVIEGVPSPRNRDRVAVAAALAFRLDRDRAAVLAAFQALDKAGVLGDLYQGTVPENLPAQVDARALMLASLAARRCAEVPELAAQLDSRASAAEAFASLDAALGRGLFRTELFWIMAMLAKLGVLRYPDLGDFTVTPHRIVRDTLFRLGFLATPYANDGPALTAATRATRRAIPDGPADEILATFALACGCAYDCTHRRTCDYPCRERLE